MRDIEKEIAKKYLLPERPFAHGMASAFDLFGVMNEGKNEELLANLKEQMQQEDRDTLGNAWRKVGEYLYLAMLEYDKAVGESGSK